MPRSALGLLASFAGGNSCRRNRCCHPRRSCLPRSRSRLRPSRRRTTRSSSLHSSERSRWTPEAARSERPRHHRQANRHRRRARSARCGSLTGHRLPPSLPPHHLPTAENNRRGLRVRNKLATAYAETVSRSHSTVKPVAPVVLLVTRPHAFAAIHTIFDVSTDIGCVRGAM